MRVFNVLVAGVVLGYPAPVWAQQAPKPVVAQQAPKFADLVGQWTRQGKKEVAYEFRADSTFVWYKASELDFGWEPTSADLVGRWRVAGDTLAVSDLRLRARGFDLVFSGSEGFTEVDYYRLIKLDGQRLTLINFRAEKRPEVIHERISPPAAKRDK